MIAFSAQQVSAFGDTARRIYLDGLKARVAERVPDLARTFDAARLEAVVARAVAGAAAQGFTRRGPIRLYFDLGIALGSGFVGDPVYPWAPEAIGAPDPETQMHRAQALYERSCAAIAEIHGPEDVHTRRALAALQVWAKREHAFDGLDLEAHAVAEMTALHPEKAAHAGPEALRDLFRRAQEACRAHGADAPRPAMLVSALMFAFGAGCLDDPIYGWIGATLADPAITTPEGRFARLERKAITWLDAVVARHAAEG